MMGRIQFNIGKRLAILSLLILIIINSSVVTYAVTTTGYTGKYDLTAHHEVNHQYNWVTGEKDEAKLESNLKAIYQQCLAWGLTKEGAAAVCGNFMNEGGMGATDSVEGMKPWEDYVYGSYQWGIGMMGFTEETLVRMLFDNAYDMGVQWMDLGAQLKTFHDYYFPLDDRFSTSHDIDDLTDYFMTEYERPREYNFATRRASAREALEKYKDLPAKDYDGIETSNNNSVDNNNNIQFSDSIVDEWDLEGMPIKSGLTANVLSLEHVSKADIAEADQRYGVALIKEDIESRGKVNAWTKARQIVVFVGLILFSYALILLLAMLFDRVNTVIDISLVGAITLGAVRLSKNQEEEGEQERVRYVTSKQLTIIIVIISLIAGVFVSGGVLPAVMKSVYAIMGK